MRHMGTTILIMNYDSIIYPLLIQMPVLYFTTPEMHFNRVTYGENTI